MYSLGELSRRGYTTTPGSNCRAGAIFRIVIQRSAIGDSCSHVCNRAYRIRSYIHYIVRRMLYDVRCTLYI